MSSESPTLHRKDSNAYDEFYDQKEKEQTTLLIEQGKYIRIPKNEDVTQGRKSELNQSLKRQALKKPVLGTLDILISVFVVTPLVVSCWRGTWELMDLYSYYFPHWESLLIGIAAHVLLAMGQDIFHDIVIETKKDKLIFRIICFLLMKIYTYVFLVITNLHWRGGWAILDYYCGLEIKNGKIFRLGTLLGVSAASMVALFLMKCLKNATAPPFAICMDQGNDMFLFPTMFRQKDSLFFVTLDSSRYPKTPAVL